MQCANVTKMILIPFQEDLFAINFNLLKVDNCSKTFKMSQKCLIYCLDVRASCMKMTEWHFQTNPD